MNADFLIEQLRRGNVAPGDLLVVHSSLHAIGADANVILEALTKAVGTSGTILMPTFTYSYEKRPGVTPYDPRQTPSMTGYLSEAFRHWPNSVRSEHPTHSVAVWGAHAKEIVAGHDAFTPAFDPDTPFDRLAKMGAKILLIGVDLRSCSSIHAAEFAARLPFLDIPNRSEYGICSMVAGLGRVLLPPRLTGCSLHFDIVEQMEGYDALGETRFEFGSAPVRCIFAQQLIDFVVAKLADHQDALLCPAGTCAQCDRRRVRLKQDAC